MRAAGSDKKDFPLCSRTVRKIEGYFSRHVSDSLGQNIHWCKAIRRQQSYPGLQLSSVCLRQRKNSGFEESRLEIYSLFKYLLLHCCTFFCVKTFYQEDPGFDNDLSVLQDKRTELPKTLLKSVV